jgi:hypothetical protein
MQRYQWILLLFVIITLVNLWINNKKKNVPEAKEDEYSENNVYVNITPMKHDIFKQISIDIIPMVLLGLMTKDNIFNIDDFENSVVGKSIMSAISFALYYQFIQPYMINKIPNF